MRNLSAIVAVLLFSTSPLTPVVAAPPATAPPAVKTVSLKIDGGKDHTHAFNKIAWRKGMTVLDAMQQTAKRKKKPLKFVVRSSGATAFVKEIDGVLNEGGGGRNWIFKVNGKNGSTSCGIHKLKPGDRILWSFERYD